MWVKHKGGVSFRLKLACRNDFQTSYFHRHTANPPVCMEQDDNNGNNNNNDSYYYCCYIIIIIIIIIDYAAFGCYVFPKKDMQQTSI